ncbi:hypothetical protein TNCV_361821 [Trichonephila clavipes]|nr:hypothetical protein TNCV_361821 [Trichonephila clavipes]
MGYSVSFESECDCDRSALYSSRQDWHPKWSSFHRPSMDYPRIILRGHQSSNGVAYNEEISEHMRKIVTF